MRGMASAKPARKCPPDGTLPFNITAAVPGQTKVKNEGKPNQKGGDACINLSLEVAEGEFAGYPAYDTLGTDGGTDFGAMSKKAWRQLGVTYVDSDQEVPDDVIAAQILNMRVYAEVKRKPQQEKNEATGAWETVYDLDEQTGVKVPKYKLEIIGYKRQPTAGLQGQPQQGQQLPQGQLAPPPQQQQFQQPPQQYAAAPGLPQGFPTGAAPQFAPPGLPQGLPPGAPGGFAPPQGGFPAAPGMAPPQFQQPQFAPSGPGGFPQVQAPQGWVQPGAPNGVAAQGAPGQVPGQQQLPGVPGATR